MERGTDSDKGWAWIVMYASFFLHVIIGSFFNCIGVFHTALLSKFEQNVTYTALTGALFTCLMTITGPLSSLLISRYNCRITILLGGFIFTIGCFLSAFLPSLEWVILTFGIVAGTGSGIVYTAAAVVIGFNFEKHLNLASGVATAGAGLGIFVFAPVFTTLVTYYGYEGLFILSSGFAFHSCAFGALCRPSQLETRKKLNNNLRKTECLYSISSFRKLIRHSSFLCMCISVFFWSIGVHIAFLHLPYFVVTLNSTPIQASWIISAAGIGGFISRFLSGLASNSYDIDVILIYSGSIGVLGFCTILFPLYAVTYAGQIVYGAALGIYSGPFYAVINSINISIVGINNMAKAYGLEMVFLGSGTLLGPPLAGLIVDNGGTYQLSFVAGGCAIILGGVFGMLTVCFKSDGNNVLLATNINTLDIVPDGEIKQNCSQLSDDTSTYAEPLMTAHKTENYCQESAIEKTLKFVDEDDT